MSERSDGLTAFSPDYATARQRFRDAAGRLGWELQAHSIGVAHPEAGDLTIDVALSPGASDGRALVLSSGLHGVEGFIGSAVQLGALQQWAETPALQQVRCIFAHGLNPYGFAYIRRTNEDSVDPNRNFLLPGEEYRGSPEKYAALDPFLNPKRPPSAWEPFALKSLFRIARFGMPVLKQTIAGGQFDFPRGLFFGGAQPARTHRILSEQLPRWIHGCSRVIHLDFHTGLGPRATCKLLIDYALTESQRARLVHCFGPDSFEISDPKLISYHVRGGFDRWCVAVNPGCDYLHLCAEYGTYGPVDVIAALRAENQAFHWGKPTDPATIRSKDRIREIFCPAAPDWRSRTYATGLDLVRQAVGYLSVPA